MQVYLLTFPNGKQYVGQTIHSVEDRIADHGRKEGLVGNAIRKYGDPEVLVLAQARNRDELDDLERQFIKQLDTMVPNGYNLTDGGRTWRASDQARENISIAQKRRFADPSQREAHSQAHLNYSPEIRDRMARAKIGNTNASGKRSPEFREKMQQIALQRATRRGQKHGQQSTPAP